MSYPLPAFHFSVDWGGANGGFAASRNAHHTDDPRHAGRDPRARGAFFVPKNILARSAKPFVVEAPRRGSETAKITTAKTTRKKRVVRTDDAPCLTHQDNQASRTSSP